MSTSFDIEQDGDKWTVYEMGPGRPKYIGHFDTKQEAEDYVNHATFYNKEGK